MRVIVYSNEKMVFIYFMFSRDPLHDCFSLSPFQLDRILYTLVCEKSTNNKINNMHLFKHDSVTGKAYVIVQNI